MTNAEKEILSDAIETCIELEKENKMLHRAITAFIAIIVILSNILILGG